MTPFVCRALTVATLGIGYVSVSLFAVVAYSIALPAALLTGLRKRR